MVVVFGAGAFGQLGHGSTRELRVPTRLAGLGALRVRAAACGDYHSAVLSSDGELFTFGIGEFGVLGMANTGPHSATSQFYVTLAPCPSFDAAPERPPFDGSLMSQLALN